MCRVHAAGGLTLGIGERATGTQCGDSARPVIGQVPSPSEYSEDSSNSRIRQDIPGPHDRSRPSNQPVQTASTSILASLKVETIDMESPSPRLPFRVLIDGDCPLCKREANFLARLDRGQGRLVLEDIAAAGFDPSRYATSMDAVMGTIHGVLPDGRLVTGMEVFRRAYGAVGWGWLLSWTAWPLLRPLMDRAYSFFAKHRLRLTGRGNACSVDGRCRVAP